MGNALCFCIKDNNNGNPLIIKRELIDNQNETNNINIIENHHEENNILKKKSG